MANEATDNHTPARPPVQTVATRLAGLSGALVATEAAVDSASFTTSEAQLRQLVRIVTDLPLRLFLTLNDAFARAESYFGFCSLAARHLTQQARGRQLTVAAIRILPDDSEQALIFRSAFWRYFAILPPDSTRPGRARVRPLNDQGRRLLTGDWYCYVGLHRFERLYSAARPSVATQEPPPSPPQRKPPPSPRQQEPPPIQPSPTPEPPSPKKWTYAERDEWLKQFLRDHPPGRNKSKWVREEVFPQMEKDFGDEAPWSTPKSLYRRLSPRKTGRGRGRPPVTLQTQQEQGRSVEKVEKN